MDRAILFSAPMVRAILREIKAPGTGKTQTRRILGKTGRCNIFEPGAWTDAYVLDPGNAEWRERCTPYATGDRLWVREAIDKMAERGDDEIAYKADWPGDGRGLGWLPSIHMPRWASRLTLHVTEVRVERLQDISEEDAIAEGVRRVAGFYQADKPDGMTAGGTSARAAFALLWDSINGPDAWAANPWISAIRFRPVLANIDAGGE